MIHNELGERHPEYKIILGDLNNRFSDLGKAIFRKQLYIHPEF